MSTRLNSKRGNVVLGLFVWGLILWGIYSVFFKNNTESNSVTQEHPNYSAHQDSKDCSDLEPDNPYSEGTGHSAGFQWGENGNYCSGNSASFIEGCEEYEIQEESYQACLDN